jgi:hypothetical protein
MSAMKKSQLIAVSVYLFANCLLIPISASADTTPSNLESATVDSTRNIAGQLLNSLGHKLKTALSTDGPLAAVSVCKEAAPAIANSLSAEHGVQITRVGTRVRNQKMGIPNVWQKVALTQFEERLAAGEKPADLEYWKVVETANGKRELHYAKAIAVQPQCLSCHGQPQDIPAALAEKIRQEYPNDQATGYSAGKLRGAVVITKPL